MARSAGKQPWPVKKGKPNATILSQKQNTVVKESVAKMAQTFTAREVTPSTAENKPTIIKTEDGSKLSGFHASLKAMTPGTVFKCETEIKKGYVNIIGEPEIISKGDGVAKLASNGNSGDSPEKRASIECQNAVTNVMTAYVNVHRGEDSTVAGLEQLEELWLRSLEYCGTKIPVPGQATAKPVEEASDNANWPAFKNAGDFWAKATERWGLSQTVLLDKLGFDSSRKIADLDWAWLELEKILG